MAGPKTRLEEADHQGDFQIKFGTSIFDFLCSLSEILVMQQIHDIGDQGSTQRLVRLVRINRLWRVDP